MFVLIFCRNTHNRPQDYGSETALLQALTPYQQQDHQGTYVDDRVLICHTLTFNTAESFHEATPWRCDDSGCVIASWVRLDNRQELAEQLGIALAETFPDPQLIVAAYRKWGDDCANRLEGDFSFVIYDSKRQHVFAARDSVGVKPFYYYCDDNVFICTTTAAIFHVLNKPRLQPDESWMALYLIHRSHSWEDTALQGLKKLPPAHSLAIDSAVFRLRRYFEFRDDAPPQYQQNPVWVQKYRERLEQAMTCRLRTQYAVGSETSGGIDSSTITGFAAQMMQDRIEKLRCYAFALLELEPAFVLQTSHFAHVMHNHVIMRRRSDEKLAADMERLLTVYGLPEEHGNASFHVPFYEDASLHNTRVLFSGFGGDEVVTNPAYLLTQELIDRKQYRALWNAMPASRGLRVARFIKRLLEDRKPRPPATPRFVDAFTRYWQDRIVSDQAVEKHDLHGTFMNAATFDAPYRTINDFILHNRIGAFVPTRLDNCTLLAASYKIDYRWPLLDRRLMQQYLSTPAVEKWHQGMGRYLHRRAIEGVVPASVQWKPSKNMGSPLTTAGPNLSAAMRHTLLEQLHPALEGLIDRARFVDVCNRGEKVPGPARRALTHAYMLNRWLQRYFP
jgi:asparagine synthase (glutamine-hydrolysing)